MANESAAGSSGLGDLTVGKLPSEISCSGTLNTFLKPKAFNCLQDGATLITNDKHFDKINTDKIIEVWSISKTIEEFEI